MKNEFILTLVGAGLALGVLAGVMTRPAYFGRQTPLSVIFSTYGGDAMFRTELIQHLALTGTIGVVGGGVLAAVLSFLKKA